MGAELWELPLTLLNAQFPNAYFALVNQDFLNNRMNQAASCNIDPSLLASYSQYYAFINPYQERWTALKSGGILSSETMFPVRNISNTEFYNDWLLKAEKCTAGIGLKLDASPTDTIYLPMQSPESCIERYAEACTDILLRLRDPLERAIRMSRVLQQAGDAVAGRAALAHDSHGPAFIVDHSMRIIEANAAAMRMLRCDTLAGSRGGRLYFRDKPLSERITLQIRNLACSAATQASRIGCDDGSSKWLLSLTRLPADPVQRLLAPRAQILLRLTNLTVRPASGDFTEFSRLYRLTPAETRLSAALGDGLVLTDAANSLGITFETARQRLKQIFQKTGTTRQAELCVLLARFHGT